MPPKKGMSIEDKKMKLLDWFQTTHTVYNIKEIESTGSKKTGISSMQIKDILKLLMDDDLINCEKCGISNIYWCFKYASMLKLKNDFIKLKKKKNDLEAKFIQGKAQLSELNLNRIENIDKANKRSDLLIKAEKLKNEVNTFKNILDNLNSNSLDSLRNKQDQIKLIEDSNDILQSNIENIVSYVCEMSGIEKSKFKKEFEIPEDL